MPNPNYIVIFGGTKESNRKKLTDKAIEVREYFKNKKKNFLDYKNGEYFFPETHHKNHTIIFMEKDGERFQEVIEICQKYNLDLINVVPNVIYKINEPLSFKMITIDDRLGADAIYAFVSGLNIHHKNL